MIQSEEGGVIESVKCDNYLGGIYIYLEDGLHLGELSPRVFTSQHLNYQTTHTPDVSFLRIGGLLDDFRRHPEDRTLK